ncbi:hypothetical protein C8Q69DRAFT_217859 [Paecilomyces variotii]|uniref:Uncharacterized protein n=1 Tax=Byssochlamys spectabilis TaxID=264951 RepID=A0A443HZ81_BYSSP|nr:hypothetical protein C8Q69DRAFT_217859 [Paecilomyces variotii]RWQ97158.1 hypothetical protein C8Q69DRAFT_217859 [Paecilomyces variotii]
MGRSTRLTIIIIILSPSRPENECLCTWIQPRTGDPPRVRRPSEARLEIANHHAKKTLLGSAVNILDTSGNGSNAQGYRINGMASLSAPFCAVVVGPVYRIHRNTPDAKELYSNNSSSVRESRR